MLPAGETIFCLAVRILFLNVKVGQAVITGEPDASKEYQELCVWFIRNRIL